MARKKKPKGWTEGTVQELLRLSNAEAAEVERRARSAAGTEKTKRSSKLDETVADADKRYGKVFKRLAE